MRGAAVTVEVRWRAICPLELEGELGFERLPADLQIHLHDEHGTLVRLDEARPTFSIDHAPNAGGFFLVGIEHILFGWDHLLFVLALVLLVREREDRRRALLLTVSCFTLGHSLTLALVSIGVMTPDPWIVELLIAGSIVHLARELCLAPKHETLTRRYPQLIALGFGLVHGLGFGAALATLFARTDERLGPLLAFNLGVELGQLAFIGILVLSDQMLRAWSTKLAKPLAYVVGVGGAVAVLTRFF